MAFLQEAENEAMVETSSSRLASAHTIVTMLLCVLFAIMYLDRVNISAAASSIKAHFGLSNAELGWTFSAFSWAYLGSVLFGGWGARRYGARLTLLVCVVVVGLGTIATGIVSGLITLFAARLAVGLGEGRHFPPPRRQCAIGIRRIGLAISRGSHTVRPDWGPLLRHQSWPF